MQEEIQNLRLKVHEHDMKLTQVERLMTESVNEQKLLVRELHELTSSFKVYIERHDRVAENNARLFKMVSTHTDELKALQNIVATNQPIVDGIRKLNGKIIWAIISFICSPLAFVAILAYKG